LVGFAPIDDAHKAFSIFIKNYKDSIFELIVRVIIDSFLIVRCIRLRDSGYAIEEEDGKFSARVNRQQLL